MSAFLMASFLNGLSDNETFLLTDSMINSGDRLDLSFLDSPTADKHSTGGVGDGTSFIVVPNEVIAELVYNSNEHINEADSIMQDAYTIYNIQDENINMIGQVYAKRVIELL